MGKLDALKIKLNKIKRLKYIFKPCRHSDNSLVELYLVDSFEIYHMLPFYYELKKRSIPVVFVAEPPEYNPAGSWFDQSQAIKILEHLGVEHYTRRNSKAKVALTTQYALHLSNYNKKTIKIKIPYAAGLLKNTAIALNVSESKQFNQVFVHGKFYKDYLDQFFPHNHSVIVSFPKHLYFHERQFTRNEILSELDIRTDKPILMYYPTWDQYSSIEKCVADIEKLKNYFYVITKAHHCTYHLPEKRNDLELLNRVSDKVLEGNYDFAKSTLIGDVIVCDSKSGAVTEIPFLNPKSKIVLIVINTTLEEYRIDLEQYFLVSYEGKNLIDLVNHAYEYDPLIQKRNSMINSFIEPDVIAGVNAGVDAIINWI